MPNRRQSCDATRCRIGRGRITFGRRSSGSGRRRTRPNVLPGRGSNYFHRHVKVDDVLEVRAPAGTFFLDPLASEPVVLLGAGIGVTPLVSMLEAIVQTGRSREVQALFGFRQRGRASVQGATGVARGGKSESAAACELFGAAQVGCAVSRLQPSRADNGRAVATDVAVEQLSVLRLRAGRFDGIARAGAVGMGRARVARSLRGVWAGEREECVRPSRDGELRCEVRFERSNRTAVWDGSFASLLEFGEAAGVTMPSGCRAGSCGECMMAIRGGAISTIKQPGIPVPPGHCLTCISVPAATLVLDA